MARIKVSQEEIIKDRLAYIGTLASGLAHEINNPLNSINLNVEMMEDDLEKIPGTVHNKFKKRIKRIKSETEHLQKTLAEFLAFARPPRLDAALTDLNDFIYDIAEFLGPEFKKNSIHVKLDLNKGLFPIMIDQRQIHQVLMNLLKNAIEAINERKPELPQIIIETLSLEKELQIKISDNGEDIPDHFKEKIFEVFFTTKERGTGLGLGIVSRILREHNGELQVEPFTGPDKDFKTFTITLPKSINLGYKEVDRIEMRADTNEQ